MMEREEEREVIEPFFFPEHFPTNVTATAQTHSLQSLTESTRC